MDFHSLSRRELQALCKKNKIPANITNVAMANALEALDFVEGIEEFMHPSQSEAAQSSMESPARSEVQSPHLPPSCVRGTSRRLQTGRKEDPLKQCVEDEKMDVLTTPAPLGVASRRKKVQEDSSVKRVYSTRRSVRLAEKNMKMLSDADVDVSSAILKKELPTKIGCSNVQRNLKEDGLCDSDESSGITGADTNTNSMKNQELCLNDETGIVFETVAEPDEERRTEKTEVVDSDETEDFCGLSAVEQPLNLKDEVGTEIDTEAEWGEEPSDTEDFGDLDLNNEIHQHNAIDGMDGLINAYNKGSESNATEYFNNAVLENKDSFAIIEFCCNVETNNKTEKQMYGDPDVDSGGVPYLDVTLTKLTELGLQQATAKEASPGAGDSNYIPSELNKEEETATCFTTSKNFATEASSKTMNDRMPVFSDNKENIGSGRKVVPLKESTKKNENLEEFSVRKLSKMLKEKLEITKKSGKDDGHKSETLPRTALQALPEV